MITQVDGLDKVIKELRRRGANVTKSLEVICTAGAGVIETQAKSNAVGSIASAITKRTTERKKNRVTVSIFPKGKFYARFVEYGTKPHRIPRGVVGGIPRKNIKHPGAKARPFMRPAFDVKQGQAKNAMGEKVKELVES